MDCPFCKIEKNRIINENNNSILVLDAYPVSKYHSLIIPKKHVSEIWSIDKNETADCLELLNWQRKEIQQTDKSVLGFNIGVNVGEVAGQTVFHAHIHLIPRRIGDVTAPRGGVRGVIPSKQVY